MPTPRARRNTARLEPTADEVVWIHRECDVEAIGNFLADLVEDWARRRAADAVARSESAAA